MSLSYCRPCNRVSIPQKCPIKTNSECVIYSGANIPSLDINTGDDLDSIIEKLAEGSGSGGGGGDVLYFRIGDGGSLTPAAGSSVFNPGSNPLVGKTVTAAFGGGLLISPTANAAAGDLSWGFVTGTGILTLTNGTFDDNTVYSIWYK